MDAFEPVSVPKYNVSLLGLRSLQNQRHMSTITGNYRSICNVYYVTHTVWAGFLPGFEKWKYTMSHRVCPNELDNSKHNML